MYKIYLIHLQLHFKLHHMLIVGMSLEEEDAQQK
jgi:hypothetical protein